MQSSRIIKGTVSKRDGTSWQPFDWASGSESSSRALDHAAPEQTEAAQESISAQAMEERARREYERGYREGEAAARSADAEAIDAKFRELANTIAGLAQLRSSIYQSSQADLLRLSVAIARRILHREILISPDVLEGIISVVLDKLDHQEVFRVRVHPGMVKRVEEQLKRLAHRRTIQVAADPSMAPGGCVFQTGRGDIDASIESQLAEIERGLADHLEAQ